MRVNPEPTATGARPPGFPADRRRVLGLLLSSVAAVAAGFLLVSPAMAERLIVQGGYYHVLALTGLGLLLAARVVAARFRGGPAPAGCTR